MPVSEVADGRDDLFEEEPQTSRRNGIEQKGVLYLNDGPHRQVMRRSDKLHNTGKGRQIFDEIYLISLGILGAAESLHTRTSMSPKADRMTPRMPIYGIT